MGETQKNCVRSYLPQYKSMIFSIRNSDNKRLTCEVDKGAIVQVREVCNGEPSEEWDEVISEMKKRIRVLFNKNLLKPSVKITYKRANIEEWIIRDGERVSQINRNLLEQVFPYRLHPLLSQYAQYCLIYNQG